MDINRISACTYAMREQPYEQALQALADAGLHKADLWGCSPHFPQDADPDTVEEIAATSARIGVAIANLGSYPGGAFSSEDEAEQLAELESMRLTIAAAARLGCRSIRVTPGQGEDPSIIDRVAPFMAESAAIAEEMGVLLGMENHKGSIAGNPDDSLRLCEAVGSPWFGVLFEPCNLAHGGVDYRAAFDLFSDWIVHIHIKDGRHTDDGSFEYTQLGEGEVDVPWVVSAMESIGYQGDYALEYEMIRVEPIESALPRWVTLMLDV